MPVFGASMNSASDAASFCAANPMDPRCNGAATQTPQFAIAGYVVGNYASTTPGTTPTTVVTGPAASTYTASPAAWYTQWWGMGLIGLLAFVGYKHFVAKPKPKQ